MALQEVVLKKNETIILGVTLQGNVLFPMK